MDIIDLHIRRIRDGNDMKIESFDDETLERFYKASIKDPIIAGYYVKKTCQEIRKRKLNKLNGTIY